MLEWINLLVSFWKSIFTEVYDRMILPISSGSDSSNVFSVGSFITAALIVGLVISVFWKGAKT